VKKTIILVEQRYKSIKEKHDYRTRSEITYGGRELLMDIGKAKYNYDKDRKSRYFNYNVYEHIANNCRKLNIAK